jgi:hypothetical protein
MVEVPAACFCLKETPQGFSFTLLFASGEHELFKEPSQKPSRSYIIDRQAFVRGGDTL